ncbi:MAG: hypothetical protein NTZ13_04545 [Candidatus Parcubacteria bacterium]|nr:hypothetical protein [Candidatus Parcubacteria bacterium]
MEDTVIQNIIDSLEEFFFQLGLPVEKAQEATSDILDLALQNCALMILPKLSDENAEVFDGILKSSESLKNKSLLFWEKAVGVLGKETISLAFENSLKEILSDYMNSMENSIPEKQKRLIDDFKIRIIQENLKKTTEEKQY